MNRWMRILVVVAPSLFILLGSAIWRDPLSRVVRGLKMSIEQRAPSTSTARRAPPPPAFEGRVATVRRCRVLRHVSLLDCRTCQEPPEDMDELSREAMRDICRIACPDGFPRPDDTLRMRGIDYLVLVPCPRQNEAPPVERSPDAGLSMDPAPYFGEDRTLGGSV